MRLLAVLLPFFAVHSAASPHRLPNHVRQRSWALDAVYTDNAHGFTFHYPKAWEPGTQFGYWGPQLTNSFQEEGLIGFGANPYPNTELEGLGIVYAARPAADAAVCDALAASIAMDLGDTPKPRHLILHGKSFSVRDTSGAGMNQGSYGELYATYRSGTCLLFETNVANKQISLLEPEEGEHPMSRAQSHRVDATLAGIVRTLHVLQ